MPNNFDPDNSQQIVKQKILFSKYKSIEEGSDQIIENCRNEHYLRDMFYGWQPHM